MKIIDLVANEPLPPLETNDQPGFCPYCGSKKINQGGTTSICVGSLGYWDVNHRWNKIICGDCGKTCIRERKTNNEWYTADSVVLAGLPTCFDSYVYKCKCGGVITRKYFKLDSDEDARSLGSINLGNGVWQKQYRTVFVCDKCGQHEMEEEHWKGHECKEPESKQNKFENCTLTIIDPVVEKLRKDICNTEMTKEELNIALEGINKND